MVNVKSFTYIFHTVAKVDRKSTFNKNILQVLFVLKES